MQRSKVAAVASFEFLTTVRRKGYLIATFGMPLILLAYSGVVMGLGRMFNDLEESSEAVYGVIDESGVLQLEGDLRRSRIPEPMIDALEATGSDLSFMRLGTAILRPYDAADAARNDLLAGELSGYFLVREDYVVSGTIEEYLPDTVQLGASDATGALGDLLLERLLEARADPELASRVQRPLAQVLSWTVKDDGTTVERSMATVIFHLVVPMVFAILLFIAIMMNTSYLIQGTAIEKENKVVEVLLSSADPDEVLSGKLLGLGAAGLLQIMVWFSMAFAAGLLFAGVLAGLGVELPWVSMLAAIPFFITGYLFFGALMLAFGSLGNSFKEAQQFSGLWGMLAALPLFFLPMILQTPHSGAARILTWIPFSAPVTVMMRLALDGEGMAWWEVVGPLAVMCVSIWLAIRLGGRLFRVGLLMRGARPKLREIWRQARLAG